jgi:hypothetical protein
MTNFSSSGLGTYGYYWSSSSPPSAPVIWRNSSGGTVFGCPDGELIMHPGSGGAEHERSVIRFTAPVSGNYDVDLTYLQGDSGLVDLHLLLNSDTGTPLFESLGEGGAGGWSSPTDLSLSVGDTIDFVVGNHDGYFFDNTPFNLVITSSSVPEPSVAGGLGLLAVALCTWRLRRKS